MCSKFMMPCTSQSECGGSRCHSLGYVTREEEKKRKEKRGDSRRGEERRRDSRGERADEEMEYSF
jgi:hypothetical protein